MGKLTVTKIKALTKPGRYGDGDTLMLNVTKGGAKSWVQRLHIQRRPTHVSLGPWPAISLALARDLAIDNRRALALGRNIVAEKRSGKARPTFEKAAEVYVKTIVPRWKPGRHNQEWLASLRRHVFPSIGQKAVDRITRQDLLGILTPLWTTRPQQAKKLRQRIRHVLQWAVAHGHVEHNVGGEVLDGALPTQPHVKKHRESVPYKEVPAAYTQIGSCSVALACRLCVQFLILTAVRSNEARTATWDQIDLTAKVWVIPEGNMKARTEHRVPLSEAVLALLEQAQALDTGSGLVFPSPSRTGQSLSAEALTKTLAVAGLTNKTRVTIHGFRSTFKTWADECTDSEHAVKELCLAHTIGSATQQAYSRSDLLRKRRVLMQRWGEYVLQTPRSKVVSLHS